MNHIDLEQAIHKTLPSGGYINLDPYHKGGIKIDGVVSVESLRLIVEFVERKK